MAVASISRGKSNGRATETPAAAAPSYQQVLVEQIDVGENVRVQPGELDDMAASIVEHGVLQPVKVVGPHKDGRFKLVYGQRRLLASRLAGALLIPAIVVPAGADVDHPGAKRSIEQLVENLQRADLNPIDEAKALRQVLDADPKLKQEDLAKRLGRSPSWLSNSLRLLEVAKPVQQLIAEGKLSASHGKALAALPEAEQASVAKAAVANGLSAHDIEDEAAEIKRRKAWQAEQSAATKKRVTAAVDVVEAKVVDKETTIVVTGYEVAGNVAEALRKRGYKNVKSENYGYYGATPPPSVCDCAAVRVNLDYGNPAVHRYCVKSEHREEVSRRERKKLSDDQAASDRHRKAARAAVAAALEATPLSIDFARLLFWQLQNNWTRKDWAKTVLKDEKKPDPWKAVCSLSLEQLTAEIADKLIAYDAPPLELTEAAE